MAVITISRELGSGGTDISQKVAKTLSYALIDKNLIEAVLLQYGMVAFDDLYQKTTSIWARFDSANMQLVKMLNKTILGFARRDNSVILGRGGFAILREYTNVLNIRIQAPFPTRVQRIMDIEQISDYSVAEERIKENDKVRNGFIQAFYGVKWDTTNWFNLVIDTSRVSTPLAVKWIVEAAQDLDRARVSQGLKTREIDVDPVLEKTISDLLIKQP